MEDMKAAAEMETVAAARVDRRTLVAHVLGVAATALVLVWCIYFRGGLAFESSNKSLIFNVHPILMLIGMVVLGGEAIMSYKLVPLRKQAKKTIHWVLHTFVLVLSSIGVYAAFKYHNESGFPNLYSLHSWIGITTISLYGFQWIVGLLVFIFPGAAPAIRQVTVPWHVKLGLLVFVLAVGNVQLGFLEKLTFLEKGGVGLFSSEAFLVNFTGLLVIIFGIVVVFSTLKS